MFPSLSRPRFVASAKAIEVLVFAASSMVGISWFVWKAKLFSFIPQDSACAATCVVDVAAVLSVSICVKALNDIKFFKFKPILILLVLALIYDVFWVFLSPLIFKKSVMSEEAPHAG